MSLNRYGVRILQGLVFLGILWGMLEVVLRVVDPWGTVPYFADIQTLNRHYIADSERGYILPDGMIEFVHWSATVKDGTRVVPDSAPADCVIVFVGDSVTFGHAVDDHETFVNILATKSVATFINAGINGYNLADIVRAVNAVEADGYIYLLNVNDTAAAYDLAETHPPPSLSGGYIGLIWRWFNPRRVAAAGIPLWVDAQLVAMNRPDLLALGFDNWFSEYAGQFLDVTVAPIYRDRISIVDPHPTAAGHRYIADVFWPTVESFTKERCG